MKAKYLMLASTIASALVVGALPAQAAGVDMKIGTIHPLNRW